MSPQILRSILFCAFCFLFCTNGYAQGNESVPEVLEETIEEEQDLPFEITLEAHVAQIVLNDEHRQGVDWGAIVSDFHTVNLKKEDNPVWMDKKYKLSVGTISDEDLVVLLDALDTVGHLAQYPQDQFDVAIDKPVTARLKVGDEGTQDIRLELLMTQLKSGVHSLRVEPHVLLLTSDVRNGKKAPLSLALKAPTDIALKDNTTIILGGIIREEEITKTHKFPLLGDLPLVGLVFRNQGHWMQRTETVIFLTVRMKALKSDATP